jgi:hypothetical protein
MQIMLTKCDFIWGAKEKEDFELPPSVDYTAKRDH